MNILLTGANGYIGQRLLPVLLEQGHTIYCCVRNRRRFEEEHIHERVHVLEIDFETDEGSIFPTDIDVAYYLIHSMSSGGDFVEKEAQAARHFIQRLEATNCRQIVYLGGIVNEAILSQHLASRLQVEHILGSGRVPLTALRAGIIVGSGSASFEIMRDLVEKLPVMVTPQWLDTLCQPIGVRNVIQFLAGVLLRENTFGKVFDIGGPEVLSYKNMLLRFASVRKLKRWIFTLPVMTPRLSSYWLYFITSTSYPLAVHLVNSMKVPVVCRPNNLAKDLGIELLSYRESVELAFQRIDQNAVISSWKDAFVASGASQNMMDQVEVPTLGCFKEQKWREIADNEGTVDRIWRIGDKNGWYYGTRLWQIRGWLDKAVGGVGLRRGRRSPSDIHPGDALDFWRVLVAQKSKGRLLLFAEMKLPGEAWLEFRIMRRNNKLMLRQTATFRPQGLWGRLYWYLMLPFHFFIFNGMADRLVGKK